MPINPPNSIFKRIVAGKLILKPEQFKAQKTKNGLILPRFGPKQAGRLRAKLLQVGIDPVKVGMPPLPPPNTSLQVWPEITYSDAMKEIKFDFVKQQVAKMSDTLNEWRKAKKEAEKAASRKKLPF